VSLNTTVFFNGVTRMDFNEKQLLHMLAYNNKKARDLPLFSTD